MLGPPEVRSNEPQVRTRYRPDGTQTLTSTLERVTPLAAARRRARSGGRGARFPRPRGRARGAAAGLAQSLHRDLAPEDQEARRGGGADHDHRREIDGALDGQPERPGSDGNEAGDEYEGGRNAELAHSSRVRFTRGRSRRTTTPATTTSSSSSATASASTRTTSSSASRQPPSSSACSQGTSSTTTRRPTWSSSSSGTRSKSPAARSAATSFATGRTSPSSRASRSSTG